MIQGELTGLLYAIPWDIWLTTYANFSQLRRFFKALEDRNV